MKKRKLTFIGLVLVSSLTACGGSGGGTPPADNTQGPVVEQIVADTSCTPATGDSPEGLTSGRIHSEDFTNTHGVTATTRTRVIGIVETNVTVDYMVHQANGKAKALLILLPGGDGNAKFETAGGGTVTFASGNFLVRSAHLFAEQGYKVVTVNRPSDFATYTHYDDYRRSAKHAIDLSVVINAELITDLPVIVAGTSRGAISAVAQHRLVDAVALSSPVTTGASGTPVSEASLKDRLKPSSVTVPAHMMLHVKDACTVSPPAGSIDLVAAFNPDASVNVLEGGFDATDKVNDCKANAYHGFFGIESCAVGATTDWLAGLSLPTSRPIFGSANKRDLYAIPGTPVTISLPFGVEAVNGGTISYSLPHGKTSLGGTVTIDGNQVTYTASAGSSGLTDTYVFIAEESGGGKFLGTDSISISTP